MFRRFPYQSKGDSYSCSYGTSLSCGFYSFVSKLAPEIEIYIIPDQQSGAMKKKYRTLLKSKFNMQEAIITITVLLVTTLFAIFLDSFHVHITSIVLLYVLASCFIGMMTFYPLYNLIATFLSLLLIDIFFVEPRFSLLMDSKEYPIMFLVMMIVWRSSYKQVSACRY